MADLSKYKKVETVASARDLSKYKLTPAQIGSKRMEQREGAIAARLNPVQNVGVGLVKSGVGLARGLGELGTKIGEGIGLPSLRGSDIYKPETERGAAFKTFTEGTGLAQKGGKLVGDIAQFLIPSRAIAAVEKPLGLIGRMGVEAATTAGITAAQTGGDKNAVTTAAGFAAAIPAVGSSLKFLAEVRKTKGFEKIPVKIQDNFTKAIRPNVKPTAAIANKYFEKAGTAIHTIVQNKEALQFADDAGNMVSRLPQNLDEFSQAITQTKKQIFEKYNSKALQAGEAGRIIDLKKIGQSRVDLASLAEELRTIASSKKLKVVAPDVAKYADDFAKRLGGQGKVSPKDAQDMVQILNDRLAAFEKSPNYGEATHAVIDAMVRNRINQGADDAIEKALETGGYLDLKGQYGALKEIERDVVRRAMVEARKNPKGLIDFTDVFSGGQVISGIISLNPAQVTQGLTQKLVAGGIKKLNNPNRMVAEMFEQAEKVVAPKAPRGTTSSILQRVFGQPTASIKSANASLPKNTPIATPSTRSMNDIITRLPQLPKKVNIK